MSLIRIHFSTRKPGSRTCSEFGPVVPLLRVGSASFLQNVLSNGRHISRNRDNWIFPPRRTGFAESHAHQGFTKSCAANRRMALALRFLERQPRQRSGPTKQRRETMLGPSGHFGGAGGRFPAFSLRQPETQSPLHAVMEVQISRRGPSAASSPRIRMTCIVSRSHWRTSRQCHPEI